MPAYSAVSAPGASSDSGTAYAKRVRSTGEMEPSVLAPVAAKGKQRMTLMTIAEVVALSNALIDWLRSGLPIETVRRTAEETGRGEPGAVVLLGCLTAMGGLRRRSWIVTCVMLEIACEDGSPWRKGKLRVVPARELRVTVTVFY